MSGLSGFVRVTGLRRGGGYRGFIVAVQRVRSKVAKRGRLRAALDKALALLGACAAVPGE